ncbi:MAG: Ig-like domain-containing domain [Syntrophales bacterium]
MKIFLRYCGIILMLAGAIAMSACGGGGDGGAPASAGLSGKIVQGPVSGALVFADHNDGSALANGSFDAGEISTTSNTDGTFTYPGKPGYAYISHSTGGTDTTTNKPALPMAAPPDVTVISPLTTMVALTPPAQQAALIVKLESIMGGASYASNPADSTTPAALALTKSIESAMTAVGGAAQQAAAESGGTTLTNTQIDQIGTTVAQKIADQLSSPAVTTTTLTNSATLASTMATGAVAAAAEISSMSDTHVIFSNATVISNAVNTAVNTVSSEIATQTGSAPGSLAISAASAVPEASVIQPIAARIAHATSNAINTSSQTVAAIDVVAGDTTRPTVTGVIPADLATGVSLKSAIRIGFSKTMNPATITGTTFFLRNPAGNDVPGTITYESSNSAILTPSASLAPGVRYQATLNAQALDLSAKLGLAADKSWSFTTAAAVDTVPPIVTAISPADSSSSAPVDAKVAVTFNKQIDPATLTAENFSVIPNLLGALPVSGTVRSEAIQVGGIPVTQATFIPAGPLAYNTTYRVILNANIKSIDGTAMALKETAFTTAAPVDTTKPAITLMKPAAGATGAPVATKVSVTFDKQIDVETLAGNLTLSAVGGANVPGTIDYNFVTRTATFTPASLLATGAGYTATASTGIRDTVGNPLAQNVTITFTTVAADTTNPKATLRTSPSAGAAGVPVSAAIIAGFDKEMDATTLNTTNFTLKTAAGGSVAGTVSYSAVSNSATFTPTATLSYGVTYTATVTIAIKDKAGNPLAQNVTLTFTTVTTGSSGGTPDI